MNLPPTQRRTVGNVVIDVEEPQILEIHPVDRKPAQQQDAATFPKLFTPQSPVRRLYFVGKECPVYFYRSREVRRLAEGAGLKALFSDCGPIWTIAFEK